MSNNSFSNSNPPVSGMMYPVSKGMLAGNPRDSAIQQMNNTNNKQAALNSAVGGRKRIRKGGAIVVPQFSPSYPQQCSDSTGTNAQIAGLSKTSTQASANSVYDYKATQKGGNTNWKWGCYSGGRRRYSRSCKMVSRRKIRRNKISRKKIIRRNK